MINFYRGDESRQTNNGGTGLGLAITKEIIELHNGTICVKSNDEIIEFQIILKKSDIIKRKINYNLSLC
ncbi:MAG: ATP-binding protein [Bacilli bacterium]|nr:MAG: ATP-binding protein [Bacilli bacterium]